MGAILTLASLYTVQRPHTRHKTHLRKPIPRDPILRLRSARLHQQQRPHDPLRRKRLNRLQPLHPNQPRRPHRLPARNPDPRPTARVPRMRRRRQR